MYLSKLLINVGNNPDRPRPGRLWLRDIYAVHQRLCMAFPDDRRKSDDELFLNPHKSGDFPAARLPGKIPAEDVREQRSTTAGLLFRIDPLPGNRAMIRVQSAAEPDWFYAFGLAGDDENGYEEPPRGNAGMLLAAPPERKLCNPGFASGERYRFRVLMNLSQKISKRETGEDLRKPHPKGELDKTGRPKSQGKRAQLTWPDGSNPVETILPWFERKALVKLSDGTPPVKTLDVEQLELIKLGWVQGYKPVLNNGKGRSENNYRTEHRRLRFRSALLEGVLRVEDAAAFTMLHAAGIGPAKAFGFGLLSLARL